MGTLPFYLSNLYGGFADASGLVRLESDAVVVEFEVKDGLVGAIRSAPRIVTLALADIESVRYKPGWFSPVVVIQAKSLKDAAEVPGSEEGAITLRIRRKNRSAAHEFASSAQLLLAERRLEETRRKLER